MDNMSEGVRGSNRPNSNRRNRPTGNRGHAARPRRRSSPVTNACRPSGSSILVFLLFFALQTPAAAQVTGAGVMRFATDEDASIGAFASVAADVSLMELFGYLSHDAGLWAIQVGGAVPIVRLEALRVSIRFGTHTAISGPDVEPDIQPTVGTGVRIGRRFGVLTEMDRTKTFTLWRAGLFVNW